MPLDVLTPRAAVPWSNPLEPRIGDLLVGPTNKVEAHHHQHDAAPRGQEPPPGSIHDIGGIGIIEDGTPAQGIRITDTQETDTGFCGDAPGNGKGTLDQGQAQNVGRDVLLDDS